VSLIGEERKKSIMDILDIQEKVSVGYLANQLKVTTETIRKYLEELEKENKLKKVYGGAIRLAEEYEEPSYLKREILFYEEKRRIGRKAAEFVQDNDVIAVDEGSTVLQMIGQLVHKRNITICTNSFPVVALINEYAGHNAFDGNVIFLGGTVSLKHMRVSGRLSEKMMGSFYVDKAFISLDGISLKHGLTSLDAEKGMLSVKMMEQAKESYILVDQSKFEVRGLYRMAELDKTRTIISDKDAPEDWKEEISARGIRWIVGTE
jgi:DeoR family fructose operon transcriptional repressor